MLRPTLRGALVCAALLLTCAPGAFAAAYGPSSRNFSDDTRIGSLPDTVWQTSLTSATAIPACTPEVVGGRVFHTAAVAGDGGSRLRAYDAANGDPLWAAPTTHPNASMASCPSADANRVVQAIGPHDVRAYWGSSGATEWTKTLPGDTVTPPILTENHVMVAAITHSPQSATLYALNAYDGSVAWSTPIAYTQSPVLVLDGGRVLVQASGSLSARTIVSGSETWGVQLGAGQTFSSVVTDDYRVYAAYGDGASTSTTTRNSLNGTEQCTASLAGSVELVADDDALYASAYTGVNRQLRAYDAADGSDLWTVPGVTAICLARYGDQLISDAGVFRTTDGATVRVGTAAWASQQRCDRPAVAVGHAYAFYDGQLRALRDKTAPVVTVAPTDGARVADTTPELTWSVTDAEDGGVGLGTTTVTFDGATIATTASGSYTPSSALSEGPHTLTVDTVDRNSINTTKTATFRVDTTPPSNATIVKPAAGGLTGPTPALQATATDADAGPVHLEYRIDGGSPSTIQECPGGSCNALLGPLSDGPHTVEVVAIDGAGTRSAPASRSFVVDAIAPSAPALQSPTSGATLAPGDVTFTWDSSTDANALEYVLDVDGTVTVSTGTSATRTLGAGTHEWSVTAVDAAGNQTASGPRTFTIEEVDPSDPTDPGTPPAPGQQAAAAGPACVEATPQRQQFDDAVGDAGVAPDLRIVTVEVAADCTVAVTFGLDTNALLSADLVALLVDTDRNDGTGSKGLHGADRFFSVAGPKSGLRAGAAVIDPATGGAASLVAPQPTASAELQSIVVLRTTVAALGLHPGQTAGIAFQSSFRAGSTSAADFLPLPNAPELPLTVQFRSTRATPPGDGGGGGSTGGGGTGGGTPTPPTPKPPTLPLPPTPDETTKPARPALAGTAKVGKTLRCTAPAGMRKPVFSWLRNGKAITGAKAKSLKLRGADAGKKVGCQVKGTLAGKNVTIRSATKKVARR